MSYKQSVEVEIELTYVDVANEFCNMGETEQAAFFNEIAKRVLEWKNPLAIQLHAMSTSGALKPEGRQIMRIIGEYANVYE